MKNLKVVYYIWGILLAVLLCLFTFVDTDLPMIPILAILLFGGAALFRSWKKSLVKIIIEEDAVHLHMFDGQKRSIIPEGVTLIREINGGTAVHLKDGSEYHAKKGKITICIGDEVVHEFREDDFPYAEFRRLR